VRYKAFTLLSKRFSHCGGRLNADKWRRSSEKSVVGRPCSELRAPATAFKLLDGGHRGFILFMARLIALKKHSGLPTNIKQIAGKKCSEEGMDGCESLYQKWWSE
jgi:hypothetical protein